MKLKKLTYHHKIPCFLQQNDDDASKAHLNHLVNAVVELNLTTLIIYDPCSDFVSRFCYLKKLNRLKKSRLISIVRPSKH